jgi:hypothetical protein
MLSASRLYKSHRQRFARDYDLSREPALAFPQLAPLDPRLRRAWVYARIHSETTVRRRGSD